MDTKRNFIIIRHLVRFIIHSTLTAILFYGCQGDSHKNKAFTGAGELSVRKTQTLSDNWKFQIDARDLGEKDGWYKDSYSKEDWAEKEVPRAWDTFDEGMWAYLGIGWYSTVIDPEDFVTGQKVTLNFGRVMYYSKVWLNGEYVGENIGGYLPFSFDITEQLDPDKKNNLVIRVDNRPRIEWLPAAEQIEWIQYGGILEPVKLVSHPHIFIDDLTITTRLVGEGALINCKTTIKNESHEELKTEVEITVIKDSEILRKNVIVTCQPNKQELVSCNFDLKNVKPWSPESPELYVARVNLLNDGNLTDSFYDKFGIREVEVGDASILLNGEPLLVKGVNRYEFFAQYGPTPPEKLVREELALMKSIGINMIRVHYPVSPSFLNLLDEYGFLMMEEIPLTWWGVNFKVQSIGGEAEQSLEILPQAKSELTSLIARDKNHPCIIIWSMSGA